MVDKSILLNKWDISFLEDARETARRSKDPSKKCGCVIVRSDRTVAGQGFNGFPKGVVDSPERYADKEFKRLAITHAEINAAANSRDATLNGYSAYVYGFHICAACAGLLIQRGISRIVCTDAPTSSPEVWERNFEIARTMLAERQVELVRINRDWFDEQYPSREAYASCLSDLVDLNFTKEQEGPIDYFKTFKVWEKARQLVHKFKYREGN